MLHVYLDKPEYNLTNTDIDGTKPQILKFLTKREASNPLNPVYKLPSFTVVPPEPPRFIRDAMKIDDIEGSKPKVEKQFAPRDTLNCFDIQGSFGKAPYVRKEKGVFTYDNLSYDDVTKRTWQSRRHTNPLDPSYTVWDRSLGD